MVRWKDCCAPSVEGLCLYAPFLYGEANDEGEVSQRGFFIFSESGLLYILHTGRKDICPNPSTRPNPFDLSGSFHWHNDVLTVECT